ncbi:MAG: D-sedoheptulose-7-phosphate isomerase [Candidatus Rhabdochlamydia sp.]
MQKEIESAVDQAIRAIVFLKEEKSIGFIKSASQLIAECFAKGGKLLIAGNGGSLCDAMHFAEELTGQFRYSRKALPAIALSDPGHLSCIANDMGFDLVFARAVEALGKPEDLFIALTTSGNSINLFKAMITAQKKGLKTIAFLGKTGGKLQGMADLEWIVSGFAFSDRIQEAHMTAIHIIIEQIESLLFQTEPRAVCVSS